MFLKNDRNVFLSVLFSISYNTNFITLYVKEELVSAD